MATRLQFFFDVASPTAYLAWKRLPGIEARTGAEIALKPVLLGGIFKATGNNSPILVPAKAKWMVGDLDLWARHDEIAFRLNPHFPVNTLKVMRGAMAAKRRGELARYAAAMFDAMWFDGHDVGDAKTWLSVLGAADLDEDAYAAAIEDAEVKAALVAATDAAVAAGLFGVPSFIVGERLFFGQDRMMFVEAALKDAA